MIMRYKAAVQRAAAELALSISDPSRDERAGSEAFTAALYAFVGDPDATAFPVEALERVRRDVLIAFGDKFSERICRRVEQQLGTEAAEVADRMIVEDIAELIRKPIP
jgi:hypothetical protein